MIVDQNEDEAAFAHRRAEEERGKMRESSCIVRAVHEELVELYEEREAAADDMTGDLEALAKRIP